MTMICPDYKIGATLLGMVRLPDLGIPDPWNAPYDPFSSRTQAGDGRIVGHGYPFTTWEWPMLSYAQANLLAAYVPSTDASAKVYIRTRLPSGAFANFYAVLVVPVLTGTDGTPAEFGIAIYSDFKARLIHLVPA